MQSKVSLVIPSIKSKEYLESKIEEIKKVSSVINQYFYTCDNSNSASINRNMCLQEAKYSTVIMMDDDIEGFYSGWDKELLDSLTNDVMIVAPRLMNKENKYALMMGDTFNYKGISETLNNRVCTACIAFRKKEMLNYDENFIGSGFEDDDIMIQMNLKFPNKKVIINNNVKLIHVNDMKNQKGKFWEHNKKYFLSKYPNESDRWHN